MKIYLKSMKTGVYHAEWTGKSEESETGGFLGLTDQPA